jgi:hypothetical protein
MRRYVSDSDAYAIAAHRSRHVTSVSKAHEPVPRDKQRSGLAKPRYARRLSALAAISAEALPSAEELNSKFGIPGSVAVVSGECGNPKVVLTHECGSSAEVWRLSHRLAHL